MKKNLVSLLFAVTVLSLFVSACSSGAASTTTTVAVVTSQPASTVVTAVSPTFTPSATDNASTPVSSQTETPDAEQQPTVEILRPTALPRPALLSVLSENAAKVYVILSASTSTQGWSDFLSAGSAPAKALKATLLADQAYFYWVFRLTNIMANNEDPSVSLVDEIAMPDGRMSSIDDPKVGKAVSADAYPVSFPYKPPSRQPSAIYPEGAFDSVGVADRQAFVQTLTPLKDGGDLYLTMMGAVGGLVGYDANNYKGVYAVGFEMLRAASELKIAAETFNLK